ncbi:unnamed protein product [Brassicogethes aeneus]|uniref:Thyroid transcription factor 1-associated protein 26 homolog n=1 Tax=Brassicogethes aeneus TaxID=1431903 RepID=A0A9P0AZW3_BRAAE|nr:unnamed protein product [Brassicogethes aeneus]
MGKNNRVSPDRPFRKRDNFFDKSKPEFKAKNKFPNKYNKAKPTDLKPKKDFLKPSTNGSNDFFVKPFSAKNEISKQSEKPDKKVNTESQKERRPFDKKAWRLKKYSKKYKLDQWEDKRKKAVLRGYYRNLKDDEPKLDVKKIYEENPSEDEDDAGRTNEENENNLNKSIDDEKELPISEPEVFEEPAINAKQKKNKAFKKAHMEFQRLKEEKLKKKEEVMKVKAEKEKAIEEYKKKKNEKFKRLNKKTKRGQPIMKDRIEMLLERIQQNVNN